MCHFLLLPTRFNIAIGKIYPVIVTVRKLCQESFRKLERRKEEFSLMNPIHGTFPVLPVLPSIVVYLNYICPGYIILSLNISPAIAIYLYYSPSICVCVAPDPIAIYQKWTPREGGLRMGQAVSGTSKSFATGGEVEIVVLVTR